MSDETKPAPDDALAICTDSLEVDPGLASDSLAALNHKLRTPLNAIIGFAELAALQTGEKPCASDLQQILKSARKMLQIIESELAPPRMPLTPLALGPFAERACDVLYVEDDMVIFTLVERILEFRPGLKIIHAPQGQLGIEMARAYQPQLMLLDLNLPDMHGADVLRMLQKDPATERIPVVVLSADATPSQIERLLTAGARNYLTKPLVMEPFLAVVDEYVTLGSCRAA
jgi:CheY-like chemotaxis protein